MRLAYNHVLTLRLEGQWPMKEGAEINKGVPDFINQILSHFVCLFVNKHFYVWFFIVTTVTI